MEYFKTGLTEAELKKEYHKLAMKYHPDNRETGSNEVMQKINAEYDQYFISIRNNQTYQSSTNSHGFNYGPFRNAWENIWKSYQEAAEAKRKAERSRERILFMIRNKHNYNKFIAFDDYLSNIYVPDSSWTDVHEGFAKCTIKSEQLDRYTVIGKNIKLETPSYQDMTQICISQLHGGLNERYFYVSGEYGSFYINEYGTEIIAKIDNKVEFIPMSKRSVINYSKDNFGYLKDFPFIAYLDCTYDEFAQSTYIDWRSDFDQSLKMKMRDGDFTQSGLASFLSRKKVIEFYESTIDRTMRYGTFNTKALIPLLPNLTSEDIDEVIDYINNLNGIFLDKIKGKIKKGKIKVVI